MDKILAVEHLTKHFVKKSIFGARQSVVRAADDVSFSVGSGEVFVLAGESGSGKSTIAKLILRSLEPDSGTVSFEGRSTGGADGLGRIRAGCQMIQQDPYDSVNPRMRVGDIVSEPLEISGMPKLDRRRRMLDALREVRLEPAEEIARKYPHMLSGGQRQRVVVARALATGPRVIIADEPVSMLDVSIRAEMLELMQGLVETHDIAFVYITHDLATAKHFGHTMAVLYMGRIVEMGPIGAVLARPRHPYTRALIDAIPDPDPDNLHRTREIRILDKADPTRTGCRFGGRCPYFVEQCMREPVLEEKEPGHLAACHVSLE